jgi:hypothetical protein
MKIFNFFIVMCVCLLCLSSCSKKNDTEEVFDQPFEEAIIGEWGVIKITDVLNEVFEYFFSDDHGETWVFLTNGTYQIYSERKPVDGNPRFSGEYFIDSDSLYLKNECGCGYICVTIGFSEKGEKLKIAYFDDAYKPPKGQGFENRRPTKNLIFKRIN